jgi:hypothetical protein
VDWVYLGPSPWLATCDRCEGRIEMPAFGITLDSFVRYLRLALNDHASCVRGIERRAESHG